MRVFGHTIAKWLFLTATSVVCLAQTLPSTPGERAAKVSALTGQVSVLKDNYPWALHIGDPVKVRQMIVTGPDGFATFDVSDGSTFEVFPNSKVVFRENPSNWIDLLDLAIGRVKVHVQKLSGGQPNPTRVKAPTAVISVRGTIFDVVAEDEDMTLVSVDEGAVEVTHAIFSQKRPTLVSPGETLRVYRNQPLAQQQVDKSRGVQMALRAAAEALYRVIYRVPGTTSGGPSGGSGGGTGSNGDTKGNPPPPSAPPPPAPPPPASPGH